MTKQVSINEIRDSIPHRYPFLLIDRVLDWIPHDKLLDREFRNKLNYRLLFKEFLNHIYNDSIKSNKIVILKKDNSGVNNSKLEECINIMHLLKKFTDKLITFFNKLIYNKNVNKFDMQFLADFVYNYSELFKILEKRLDLYKNFKSKLNSLENKDKYVFDLNYSYLKSSLNTFDSNIKNIINLEDYNNLQTYFQKNDVKNYLETLLNINFL